ncbi:SH3 domain-containing protein [Neobacillus sp. PS3-34]|uniref:SH3 domain-containing protein n=1 Tax=Neobacillus sp. PS3-34 TaxID=3070678 RepID=UPI0027DFC839|nr:SH3 domain-containing protein [Neobacillus sp. PS3-34]WML46873.1 SH3 domain-containing protein [Neobacillus sp. PS3-34]
MKKIIASSVLATTVLFPVLVNAEEFPQNYTTVQKVEIHKGATLSYPVVTSINSGQKVTAIDEFTNTSGELWYRLAIGDLKGWAKADQLNKVSASIIPAGQNAVVVQTSAAIRRGATSSYAIVKSVAKGQTVKVLANVTNSAKELWYQVEKDGIKGWVKAEQLGPVTASTTLIPNGQYGTVVQSSAAIRKGATSSYVIVKTVSKDQTVKVIGNFKNSLHEQWYQVEKDGIKGWMIGSALKQAALPPAPATDTALPEIGSYVYSQLNGLEARRGAALSYAKVATLSVNQKVMVTHQYVSSTGEAWVKVQITPTLAGWVPAANISDTQSINLNLYVTADSANLRSGASMDDSIVGQTPKGSTLKAVSQKSDPDGDIWYKVVMNDGTFAWVAGSVVSKQAPALSSLYVATRNTNLYSGASTQYKVKQKLAFLSKVTVLKEFTNSLDQTWVNIKTSAGVTGWTPKKELVSSKSEIHYVYAMNKAAVRRGASVKYAVNASLKENESIMVLNELNGWLNVETSTGIRGWVDKSLTSPVSLKRLITPYTETVDGDQYLNWKKPYNYKFTYTALSGNRLKLTGGFTDIELPSFIVPGIKSVEALPLSSTEKSLIITFEPGYTFTLRNFADKVSVKVVPTGIAGKKIIIDAGHGGKDTGAIGERPS